MLFFFFFNDTATTEIYTLSLHYALPISVRASGGSADGEAGLGPHRQHRVCRRHARSGERPHRLRHVQRGGDCADAADGRGTRSEEHTSELQSQSNLVCRLLLEKKNKQTE